MRHQHNWMLWVASTLDHIYSSVVHSLSSEAFFRNGWGDVSSLDPHRFGILLKRLQRTPLNVTWKAVEVGTQKGHAYEVLEGRFLSPCTEPWLPPMPDACHRGRLWLMRPTAARDGVGPHGMRACFLQLPATGEHQPTRRLQIFKPLLTQGIGTVVLEGPYYGARRPLSQSNSKLLHVSDLIKLGSATVAESLAILALLRREGVQQLGVAGWSMGGVHACMVNALHPGPLACVAMVTPRSAADAYCEGALSPFTSVSALHELVDSNGRDLVDIVSEKLLTTNSIMPYRPYLLRMHEQPAADDAESPTPTDAAAEPPPLHAVVDDMQHTELVGASDSVPRLPLPGTLEAPKRAPPSPWRAPWQLPADEAAELLLSMPSNPRNTRAASRAIIPPRLANLLNLSPHLQSLTRLGNRQSIERGRRVWRSVASVLNNLSRALERVRPSPPGAHGARALHPHGPSASHDEAREHHVPFYPLKCTAPLHRSDEFAWTCLWLASAAVRAEQRANAQQDLLTDGADHAISHADTAAAANTPAHGESAAAAHEPPGAAELGESFAASSEHAAGASRVHQAAVLPHASDSGGDVAPDTAAARDGSQGSRSGSTWTEVTSLTPTSLVDHSAFDLHVRALADAGATRWPLAIRGQPRLHGRSKRSGNRRNRIAKLMLSMVLETYTDITRFPRPQNPSSTVFVAAREDAYVPFPGNRHLQSHWKGSQLWTISGGHVSSFVTGNDTYREALLETLVHLPPSTPQPHEQNERDSPEQQHRPPERPCSEEREPAA